jgi:hypothetical protein
MALAPGHSRPEAVALGVCGAVTLALALVLLGRTFHAGSEAPLYPWAERDSARDVKVSMRNFAAAVSLTCFVAAMMLGETYTGSMATRPSLRSVFGGKFTSSEALFVHQSGTAMIAIALGVCSGMLLLAMACIPLHTELII